MRFYGSLPQYARWHSRGSEAPCRRVLGGFGATSWVMLTSLRRQIQQKKCSVLVARRETKDINIEMNEYKISRCRSILDAFVN
jgi:hypothetical protein